MDVFESNLNNIIETKLQEIKLKLFEREQVKQNLHSDKEASSPKSKSG
jgi:hypothetical protein